MGERHDADEGRVKRPLLLASKADQEAFNFLFLRSFRTVASHITGTWRAKKGTVWVAVLLGVADEDGSKPIDFEEVMGEAGWMRIPAPQAEPAPQA
jgi:hypothetical protein